MTMTKRSAPPAPSGDGSAKGSDAENAPKRGEQEQSASTTTAPAKDVDWSTMVGRLKRFKDEHGHANVPLQCEDDPELGIWGKFHYDICICICIRFTRGSFLLTALTNRLFSLLSHSFVL